MIQTFLTCDDCGAVALFDGSAEPHNILLRAQSRDPGWDTADDGEHNCPHCSGYGQSDPGDHAFDTARAEEVEHP